MHDTAIDGPHGALAARRAGGDGSTLVFVHGNAGSKEQWTLLCEELTELPRLAFDLHGFGASLDAAAGGAELADYVGDLLAVCAACGPSRVVVVGHSYGASVGLAAAAALGETLAGLFFIDGAPDISERPAPERDALLAALEPATYAEATSMWFAQMLERARPETMTRVLDDLRATPRERLVATLSGAFAYAPRSDLAALGVPRHHLHLAPSNTSARALHRLDEGMSSEALTHTSHWPHLDDPERVASALRIFLATLP